MPGYVQPRDRARRPYSAKKCRTRERMPQPKAAKNYEIVVEAGSERHEFPATGDSIFDAAWNLETMIGDAVKRLYSNHRKGYAGKEASITVTVRRKEPPPSSTSSTSADQKGGGR